MGRPQSAAPSSRAGARGDAPWVGKCLDGRYRLEQQLGAGGAGTVYRARHLGLDRAVAVKVLQRQHHHRVGSRKRFEREARALAQLSHPHIVAVTDCGVDGEAPFLVMELLEGESLEARLRRGALSPSLGCEYMLQLLEGLAFVHERGLIHRDIKPGNIFLERTGQGERVKLLDFGLAKLLEPSPEGAAVTMSGEVFGTPAYMPPEQITGESIDARSDVYSVGLVSFEMIAGRRAYQGHEAELMRQQLVEPVPRLSALRLKARLEIPLDDVLQRATDKDKGKRFANAREMSLALRAALPPAVGASLRPGSLSGAPHSVGRRSRAAERNAELAGGAMRTGALLVCVLALTAILVAGSLIILLSGPEAGSHRVLVKRAIAALWEER